MKSALQSLQKIVGSHGMVCLDTDTNTISTSNHQQWGSVKYEFEKRLGKFHVSYGDLASFARQANGEISVALDGPTARFGHMGASLRLPIDTQEHWSPIKDFEPKYTQIITHDIWKIVTPIPTGKEERGALRGIGLSHRGLIASHSGKVVVWANLVYENVPSVVIPTDFASRFQEGDVLEIGDRMACLRTDTMVLYSRLVDEVYPDIQSSLKGYDKSFILDMEELRNALATVTIINDIVRMDCDDTYCSITAMGKDGQTAEAVISCSGDPVKLEISAKQILMATSFVEDTVKIEFIDETSPLKIEHGFWTSAIAGRRY